MLILKCCWVLSEALFVYGCYEKDSLQAKNRCTHCMQRNAGVDLAEDAISPLFQCLSSHSSCPGYPTEHGPATDEIRLRMTRSQYFKRRVLYQYLDENLHITVLSTDVLLAYSSLQRCEDLRKSLNMELQLQKGRLSPCYLHRAKCFRLMHVRLNAQDNSPSVRCILDSLDVSRPFSARSGKSCAYRRRLDSCWPTYVVEDPALCPLRAA